MKKVSITIAVVVLALFAWAFRYDVFAGDHNRLYRLDRWTGRVEYFSSNDDRWVALDLETRTKDAERALDELVKQKQ